MTDEKGIEGNGWLFVCAPLGQLECILSAMLPRQYLVTDYNTHRAAVIPHRQMEEFIYLYESMPYNIELMNRPLEDYLQKKQRIRITGGVFRGKEGCIMRLHRNTRLVFAFGNMTVAVSYLHAFPFEKLISLIKAIHTSLAGRWMADKTTDATKVANLYIQQ